MSKTTKFQKIEVTLQEQWQATRPNIQKSKKSYTRKSKHKGKGF